MDTDIILIKLARDIRKQTRHYFKSLGIKTHILDRQYKITTSNGYYHSTQLSSKSGALIGCKLKRVTIVIVASSVLSKEALYSKYRGLLITVTEDLKVQFEYASSDVIITIDLLDPESAVVLRKMLKSALLHFASQINKLESLHHDNHKFQNDISQMVYNGE